MYGLCSKLVSLLAQASVFVQARRHQLTTKSVRNAYNTGPEAPGLECKHQSKEDVSGYVREM